MSDHKGDPGPVTAVLGMLVEQTSADPHETVRTVFAPFEDRERRSGWRRVHLAAHTFDVGGDTEMIEVVVMEPTWPGGER